MRLVLRLLRLMWPVRWMMALSIALALVAMLANIGLMAVSGWFIAAMGLAGAAGAGMNYFTPAAIIRALAIARTGGRYAERVVSHDATLRVLAGLRRWFYERLEPLAPAVLIEKSSGDLLARIRNDIERLELVFLRVVSPVVVAALTALVVVVVMALYHGAAALVVLALLLVAGVLLPYRAVQRGAGPSRSQAETSALMKQSIVDGLDGLAELKLAGREVEFVARVVDLGDRYIADEAVLARLQGTLLAGAGFAANLALLAVVVLVVPAVELQKVAAAELPMLMLLALASFDAVAPLPLAFQSISGTLQSGRRLFDLVDRPVAIKDPEQPRRPASVHAVHMHSVSFRYEHSHRLALSDIDLEIGEGRRIAVVGETGSGKSSLVNLLVRFFDPTAGQITLGNVPIREIELESLRSRIAVQLQRPHLFAATIRENLLLARPEATQGHIEDAARAAQIHEFIMSLPKGYDTFIGAHGRLLSGGEARRLAVAQALLKSAPILILDEPTEGLDTRTAEALMHDVFEFARERSILVVTHQAAGLSAMDEIVVLSSGRITARGRFSDLNGPSEPLHEFKSRIDVSSRTDL